MTFVLDSLDAETLAEADSTVAALQARLDESPDDGLVRRVLADRLEELGSELAEGYRVLGEHGLSPGAMGQRDRGPGDHDSFWGTREALKHSLVLVQNWGKTLWGKTLLPAAWSQRVERVKGTNGYVSSFRPDRVNFVWWSYWDTRRAADDAAARAWARMTQAEREQCLEELTKLTKAGG